MKEMYKPDFKQKLEVVWVWVVGQYTHTGGL
jgi:hypothetical protein